jgi:hypothetical protein
MSNKAFGILPGKEGHSTMRRTELLFLALICLSFIANAGEAVVTHEVPIGDHVSHVVIERKEPGGSGNAVTQPIGASSSVEQGEGAASTLERRETARETGRVEYLGNPFVERYPIGGIMPNGGRTDFARTVWDMEVWRGHVYFGVGDWGGNQGPVDLWYYDPQQCEFRTDFKVDEEGIDLFRLIGDALYIPGVDATESWDYGNLYRNEGGGWEKLRTLPWMVHVFDVEQYGGRIYAVGSCKFPGEEKSSPTVYCSEDNGFTWTRVEWVIGDGAAAAFKDVGLDEFLNNWVPRLFVFRDSLYAYGTYMPWFARLVDGQFVILPVHPFPDVIANSGVLCGEAPKRAIMDPWEARMDFLDTYRPCVSSWIQRITRFREEIFYVVWGWRATAVFEVFGTFRLSSMADGGIALVDTPDSSAQVVDLLVADDHLYLLANRTSESQREILVWRTEDLSAWETVFSVTSRTAASSFAVSDDWIYVGLGEYISDSGDAANHGDVFRLRFAPETDSLDICANLDSVRDESVIASLEGERTVDRPIPLDQIDWLASVNDDDDDDVGSPANHARMVEGTDDYGEYYGMAWNSPERTDLTLGGLDRFDRAGVRSIVLTLAADAPMEVAAVVGVAGEYCGNDWHYSIFDEALYVDVEPHEFRLPYAGFSDSAWGDCHGQLSERALEQAYDLILLPAPLSGELRVYSAGFSSSEQMTEWQEARLSDAEIEPVQYLGNPFLDRYPIGGITPSGGRTDFARSVWDMEVWRGHVYFGVGDWGRNQGPVDLWSYDPDQKVFGTDITVDEESVNLFKVIGDTLYMPGVDATESGDFGNIYRNDGTGWEKLRTLPWMAHVFDVELLDGRLYALGLCRFPEKEMGAPCAYCSEDNGFTWTRVEWVIGDGAAAAFKDVGLDEFLNNWVPRLFVFRDSLYAYGTYMPWFARLVDGRFVILPVHPFPDLMASCRSSCRDAPRNAITEPLDDRIAFLNTWEPCVSSWIERVTCYRDEVMYLVRGVRGVILRGPFGVESFGLIRLSGMYDGGISPVDTPDPLAQVVDLFVTDAHLYALANRMSGSQREILVWRTADLVEWETVFSVTSRTAASSFAVSDDWIYVGLGEYISDSGDAANYGDVYRIYAEVTPGNSKEPVDLDSVRQQTALSAAHQSASLLPPLDWYNQNTPFGHVSSIDDLAAARAAAYALPGLSLYELLLLAQRNTSNPEGAASLLALARRVGEGSDTITALLDLVSSVIPALEEAVLANTDSACFIKLTEQLDGRTTSPINDTFVYMVGPDGLTRVYHPDADGQFIVLDAPTGELVFLADYHEFFAYSVFHGGNGCSAELAYEDPDELSKQIPRNVEVELPDAD